MKNQQHFVLVHGACHGAWCWYKVETLLKSAGHRVTSFDMVSCGINAKPAKEVHSDSEMYQPLTSFLESLPVDDKVILVGHSAAGIAISMAMEYYTDKIFVAVFIAARMPGPRLSSADIGKEAAKGQKRPYMDNQFHYDDGPEKPPTSFSYGPIFLSIYLYQLCSSEDLTLATKLLRPASLYNSTDPTLTDEKYGSVNRAYIITGEDKIWGEDVQRFMIRYNPPGFVKEIKDSGHMVMLSKSQDLYVTLQQIVETFS
ncbi:hypothetical protein ACHQM5_023398 [Ranunculus cassubicifolius]